MKLIYSVFVEVIYIFLPPQQLYSKIKIIHARFNLVPGQGLKILCVCVFTIILVTQSRDIWSRNYS